MPRGLICVQRLLQAFADGLQLAHSLLAIRRLAYSTCGASMSLITACLRLEDLRPTTSLTKRQGPHKPAAEARATVLSAILLPTKSEAWCRVLSGNERRKRCKILGWLHLESIDRYICNEIRDKWGDPTFPEKKVLQPFLHPAREASFASPLLPSFAFLPPPPLALSSSPLSPYSCLSSSHAFLSSSPSIPSSSIPSSSSPPAGPNQNYHVPAFLFLRPFVFFLWLDELELLSE